MAYVPEGRIQPAGPIANDGAEARSSRLWPALDRERRIAAIENALGRSANQLADGYPAAL